MHLRKAGSYALLWTIALGGCAAETGNAPEARGSEEGEAGGKGDFWRKPRPMEDRIRGLEPLLGPEDLEVAANLPYPPGNVAVSDDGRLFATYMPEVNKGPIRVVEIIDDEPVPYPSRSFQDRLNTVLSIRIHDGHLFMLDYGKHGFYRPRVYAVDLATEEVALDYGLPRTVAPPGSMLNDFVVAPDGRTLYIADQSVIAQRPAIIVVELGDDTPTARRRLHRHPSLVNGPYDVHVHGERLLVKGLPAKWGIDPIALDSAGEWLYYGALNSGEMYRVRARELRDVRLSDEELSGRVEHYAQTTMSDGMTIDEAGNLYLTDVEHSAVVRVDRRGSLSVVVQDARLRWPDGFSWAPDGTLYVSASALHQLLPHLLLRQSHLDEHGPYQIFRFTLP